MVNEPWATTMDVPFIISNYIQCTVIFDLHVHMEVPNGDPVLLRDTAIGRMLCPEGMEQAIAPRGWDAMNNAIAIAASTKCAKAGQGPRWG